MELQVGDCLANLPPGDFSQVMVTVVDCATPHIAEVYALLGRREDALRVLNLLVKRGRPVNLQVMARAYFALGDKDRGFEWLTKAFDQRSDFISIANVSPAFDGIRDDSRFNALIARLKLPD